MSADKVQAQLKAQFPEHAWLIDEIHEKAAKIGAEAVAAEETRKEKDKFMQAAMMAFRQMAAMFAEEAKRCPPGLAEFYVGRANALRNAGLNA